MKKAVLITISIIISLSVISCTSAGDAAKRDKIRSYDAPDGDGRIEAYYEKYQNSKHKIGASGPNYFDCSGFTQKAFKDIYGINLPRTSQSQYFSGSRVKRISDLKYGDLVFFNTDGKGVSHVGIYLYEYQFTHASSSLGVTISNITMDYWKTRFIEGRRVIQ